MADPDLEELRRLQEDCSRLRRERDQYRADLNSINADSERAKAQYVAEVKESVNREIKADVFSWAKRQGAVIGVLLTIATAGGVIKLWDLMSSSVDKEVTKSVTKAIEENRDKLKTLHDDAERLRSRVLDSLIDFKDQARKDLAEIEAEKAKVIEHGQKTRKEMTVLLAQSVPGVTATAPRGSGNEVLFGRIAANTVAIAAAEPDQWALDNEGSPPMGLFSQRFQAALSNPKTDVNGDAVISWTEAVSAADKAMNKKEQTPVIEGEKASDALFAIGTVAPQNKRYGTVRALLIGINEYSGGFNLRGAVNDVKGFAKLLQDNKRLLAKSSSVTPLTDALATKAAIISKITELGDATAAEDIFLIYFSGHLLIEDAEGGKHKSMIAHDYTEGDTGIGIPAVVTQLGKIKGAAVIIIDG